MAPPEEIAGDTAAAGKVGVDRPISTIVIIIAMQTEAQPLVNKFQLLEDTNDSLFPKGVPWVRYHGKYKELNMNLVWPGKDSTLGVDCVGTVSASLVTYASIQALKPDIIINAGTCGGFKAKGANIGDVYLASDVAFHDRRIPIPVFDLYGTGARCTFCPPNLIKDLNLKGLNVKLESVMIDPAEICSSTHEAIMTVLRKHQLIRMLVNCPLVILWICPHKMKQLFWQMMLPSKIWREQLSPMWLTFSQSQQSL